MKNKTALILILIICAAAILSGCQKTDAATADNGVKSVKTLVSERRTTDQTVAYTGIIQPVEKTDLSFNIAGRISHIAVAEGDAVVPGQILASIDTQDIHMQKDTLVSKQQSTAKEIQKAEAVLIFSKEDYNRSKALYEAGALSKAALDQKELAYKQAGLVYEMMQDAANQLQTEGKRLQSVIEYGTLRANGTGVVDALHLEVSEYAAPGKPVLTLRSEKLMAVTSVSAKDHSLLSLGTVVSVELDGEAVMGNIASISDAADDITRGYRVEIALPDGWGTSGAVTEVRFTLGNSEHIWIPLQSILSSTVDYVYVVEEGKAAKRVVEILETQGDEAGVSGLHSGDQIVVSGMKSLIEGMPVKIIQ